MNRIRARARRNRKLAHITYILVEQYRGIMSSSRSTLMPTDKPTPASAIGNLPIPPVSSLPPEMQYQTSGDAHGNKTTILGIEGSANKIGVGVLQYDPATDTYETLSNPRKTYISPAGMGFLPRETAWHHQNHVAALVRAALAEAFPEEQQPQAHLSGIAFTKGPGMGGPLRCRPNFVADVGCPAGGCQPLCRPHRDGTGRLS